MLPFSSNGYRARIPSPARLHSQAFSHALLPALMRRCCASKKGVAARCDPPDQSPRGQATTNPRRGRRPVLGEAMWWWSPHLHRPPLRSERQKQPTPHLVAEGRKQSMYPELVSGRAAPVRAGCEVGGRCNDSTISLTKRLIALRACRAPSAVHCPAHVA